MIFPKYDIADIIVVWDKQTHMILERRIGKGVSRYKTICLDNGRMCSFLTHDIDEASKKVA